MPYTTTLPKKNSTSHSELDNIGDVVNSNQIGYGATTSDSSITFAYKIKSIDYAKGTLIVIVKISKLGAMSQETIVTLEGFQTTTK